MGDTRCEKVHQLSRNVYCCLAGMLADLDVITRRILYTFLLQGLIFCSIGNDEMGDDGNCDGSGPMEQDFMSYPV